MSRHVGLQGRVLESEIARDAFSCHDFPQRLSPVSASADDGAFHPTLVRRRPGGVDHVHAVFPDGSARGLRVRALAGIAAHGEAFDVGPYRAACDFRRATSDCPKRADLEAFLERESDRSYFAIARGDGRRPLFVLSSTAPLLQRWFHNARPGDSPWRLYALSNGGSFLALFSYPFVIEPWLRLRTQSTIWSVGYITYAALCAWTAWKSGKSAVPGEAAVEEELADNSSAPPAGDVLSWLGLSIVTSVLLLATTSQISQNIAVIPFLWIAPLAVYLFTFILTFDSDRWYRRGAFAVAAGVLAPVTCAVITIANGIPILTQIAIDLGSLFAVCMMCHGEIARSRPSPKYLTAFYLTIAAGGAIGGAFSALIAPRIFTELDEYPLALSAACLLGFVSWMRGGALSQWTSRNFAVRIPLMALLIGGATSLYAVTAIGAPSVFSVRNFYGILRVSESSDENGPFRQLTHGLIQHGFEYLNADKRDWPTSYYGPHSGVALAIDRAPQATARGRGRTGNGDARGMGPRGRHVSLLRN